MIIIFGWTKKGKRERPLLDTHCYQCRRQTTWDWFRLTEWITGFFVPLLPIGSQHFLVCSTCHDQLELQAAETRGIKQLKHLPASESKQLHDRLVQRLEAYQLADKSETQREFLKTQRHEPSKRE
jgi:hypothetical protein